MLQGGGRCLSWVSYSKSSGRGGQEEEILSNGKSLGQDPGILNSLACSGALSIRTWMIGRNQMGMCELRSTLHPAYGKKQGRVFSGRGHDGVFT